MRPLLPFLILGAGFGMATALWELEFNNAVGPDFQFTLVERLLIAGRVGWFLLGKLCWPADLIFVYPRWEIDARIWWQYLFPLSGVASLAALWAIRRWSRGPLAAVLFFWGTLVPVLGFFNLYTYRYSLVANHYVYLASAGIFALAPAGIKLLLGPALRGRRLAGVTLATVSLAVLAGLTWRESHQYGDAETLYRTTLERDPSSWLAYTNLGALKLDTSPDEAAAYFKHAIDLKPDLAEAHGNLGNAFQRMGRTQESIAEYELAVRIWPALPGAQAGLARALLSVGRANEAVTHYAEALRFTPEAADLHSGMGDALQKVGRTDEAVAQYVEALRLKPDDAEVRARLGHAQQEMGRLDEAVAQYRAALPAVADKAEVYNSLGAALDGLGRVEEALPCFGEALRLKPDYTAALFNLGNLLLRIGRAEEAVTCYRRILDDNRSDAEAHNNLGVALIGLGRPDEAVTHFKEALRLKPDYPDARANLTRITSRRGIGKDPPSSPQA